MKKKMLLCFVLLTCLNNQASAGGVDVFGPFTIPPVGLDVAAHPIGKLLQVDLSNLRVVGSASVSPLGTSPTSNELLAEASDVSSSFGLPPGADGVGGDECFAGIGEPYPAPAGGECVNSRRKQNQVISTLKDTDTCDTSSIV